MQLTSEQEKLIERTRKASVVAKELAVEANRLNLPILARDWEWLSREIDASVQKQSRAFRDDSLTQPGTKQ